MFHDLDEALRQLLVREMPIRNGEVDIKFDQPTREWSARLSRPTLNLFLYDLRENLKLRASQQWTITRNKDGSATQRRTPARMDLCDMLTAWARESDDEHNLLARALMALFRQPHFPPELLPESLRDQPMPIPMQVAQEDILRNPSDVWNALDNEIRPAIVLTLTLAVDPYKPITTPLVRTRELRFGQAAGSAEQGELETGSASDVYWTIGGSLKTDKPLTDLRMTLVEQGLQVRLQEEGRFTIGRLRAGEYTLEVAAEGQVLKRHTMPCSCTRLRVGRLANLRWQTFNARCWQWIGLSEKEVGRRLRSDGVLSWAVGTVWLLVGTPLLGWRASLPSPTGVSSAQNMELNIKEA